MQQKLTQHYKAVLKVKVTQSCLTLCNPVDGSPPDSSVRGILQAGILKWSAIFFSRRSSWPRDQTWVSHITVRFFTVWATREAIMPQWKWKHPWCHPIYYINTPGAGVWAARTEKSGEKFVNYLWERSSAEMLSPVCYFRPSVLQTESCEAGIIIHIVPTRKPGTES